MRARASSFLTIFAQTTKALGAVIAGAAAALVGGSQRPPVRLRLLQHNYCCALPGNPSIVEVSITVRADQVPGVRFQGFRISAAAQANLTGSQKLGFQAAQKDSEARRAKIDERRRTLVVR